MAIYNSIEDILNAPESNLTAIRYNSAQDDGEDSFSCPNWIKFNGVTPNVMYASGNSWIGITTSSTEQFKVNRRDAAMWYLWVEEGTLWNYYKFFRVRWRGFTRYNSTGSDCLLDFTLLFWDNGNITLKVTNVPTAYYNGTFSLTASETYTYNAPTTSNPYVTFYSQDENNSTFEIKYELPTFEFPYVIKYLLKDENHYYSIENSALKILDITEINASNLDTYGFDKLDETTTNLITTLTNPTLYKWCDTDVGLKPEFVAKMIAIPTTQNIVTDDYDMTHHSILGIDSVVCEGTDLGIAVSFNSGVSWKYYTGTEWKGVSEDVWQMDIATLNAITSDAWNDVATTGKYRFRIIFSELTSQFKSLVVNYIN